jgi:mycofactocin precursor
MRDHETAEARPVDQIAAEPADQELVDDVLVEEVSIDGMCGVY